MMWVPEDNWPDEEIFRGPASAQGTLAIQGLLSIISTAVIGTPNSPTNAASIIFPSSNVSQITATGIGAELQLRADTSLNLGISNPGHDSIIIVQNGQVQIQGPVTSVPSMTLTGSGGGSSLGLKITAGGVAANDYSLSLNSRTGVQQFIVYGNGGVVLGDTSSFMITNEGPGTLNAHSGLFINNSPVLAGQGGNAAPTGPSHGMIVDDNFGDDQGFNVGGIGATLPNQQFLSGTFIGTVTGLSAVTTATCTYVIAGSVCIVNTPAGMTGTSNANTLTMTGLPSVCQPATQTQFVQSIVENDASNVAAAAQIAAGSGTVTFLAAETNILTNYIAYSSTGFLTTGTKGLNQTTLIYSLF
jgi:hypothetical protein